MGININGITIPEDGGKVIINGIEMTTVYLNTTKVWEKISHTGPVIIGTSKTIIAGKDFPLGKKITVSVASAGAGGGGGAWGDGEVSGGAGGGAGAASIIYNSIDFSSTKFTNGQRITITIGAGGIGGAGGPHDQNNGKDGSKGASTYFRISSSEKYGAYPSSGYGKGGSGICSGTWGGGGGGAATTKAHTGGKGGGCGGHNGEDAHKDNTRDYTVAKGGKYNKTGGLRGSVIAQYRAYSGYSGSSATGYPGAKGGNGGRGMVKISW
jgi:hypothetical protein